MSVDYVDVVRLMRDEHTRVMAEGNDREAAEVVHHLAAMYGLPGRAAESLLNEVKRGRLWV